MCGGGGERVDFKKIVEKINRWPGQIPKEKDS